VVADLAVTTPGVQFRVTVDDLAGGVVACTETYDVFVNTVPGCIFIAPAAGTTITGATAVQYGTDDADGHPLDITYEFDAGGGFQLASRVGGGPSQDLGVSPGGFQLFQWDAPADIVGAVPGVVFRVTLDDGYDTGSCSVTVDADLPSCPPPGDCGDCNQDGVVSILDSLAAAQIAAGVFTPTPEQFNYCNVQGTLSPAPGAVVDVLDSLTIAQYAAGLPVTLTCC
jgi:hypothetical protein